MTSPGRIRRAEHALLAVALVGVATWFVWRGDTDWWRVAFWAIAPDVALIPLALGWRHATTAYNATHTYVVMLPTLAIASMLQGHVVLPLVAWAAHIEVDRALGFDLR